MPGDPLVHARLAVDAARALERLRAMRGASAKTHRRMARAAAVMLAAAGLVAGASLVS
jgi:hypothetical protein